MNLPTSSKATLSVQAAVTGALVTQLGRARGLSLEQLLDPDCSKARDTVFTEIAKLGLDMEQLADTCCKALTALFIESHNARCMADEIAGILWTVLGDPESGPPPALYYRAASLMHITFVGLLSPDILEPFLENDPASAS